MKIATAHDPLGNLSKGEYTGYSNLTKKFYVSFYNGYCRAFDSITDITFINNQK